MSVKERNIMTAQKKKSILEAGRNQIMKLADYELEKIVANINDINTDPTKKRVIDIRLTFTPSADRTQITMISQVKSKVEPTAPTSTTLFNVKETDKKTGEVFNILKEVTPVAPGQFDIFGNIQEQEVFVIGMSAYSVIDQENIISEKGAN